MQSVFDVAIIGAGPGGSNAAATILPHGYRVVQVDRASFPRMKPCGGGMTMKSTQALRLRLDPSVLATWDAVEFNRWGARVNRYSSRTPILKMVYRPAFDNALVEQNKQAPNFTFHDHERVTAVDYDGLFHITTDQREITARQLIGADGAYSMVNKRFGVATPRDTAFAIEVNLARDLTRSDAPLYPCFDFGAIEQGYGWVFPKGDIVNVGLYSFARGASGVRERLTQYIRDKGITYDAPLPKFEAHQIPVGGFTPRVPVAPLYVVGDAGAFADALTGEGIYHALESGRLAGKTVVEALAGRVTHHAYYRRLWRSVLSDTMLTYYFSRIFYAHINRSMRILENPLVWRPLVQGYASGATFTESLLGGGYYQARSLLTGSLSARTVDAPDAPDAPEPVAS